MSIEEQHLQHFLTTYTGRRVRPFLMTCEDVVLRDIAHSLARICRFLGHVQLDGIYSVAEHCVRASYIFPEAPREIKLAIVLHDAHEAYFGDYIRPVKKHPMFELLDPYLERAQDAIHAVFGLEAGAHHHALVKRADDIMAWTELRDVMAPFPREDGFGLTSPDEYPLPSVIVPWTIRESREKFEARVNELLEK